MFALPQTLVWRVGVDVSSFDPSLGPIRCHFQPAQDSVDRDRAEKNPCTEQVIYFGLVLKSSCGDISGS